MKTYLGEKGINETWQEPFPKTTKCHKCKGTARIMFTAIEGGGEKDYICDLQNNTGARKNGKYWVHDACAVSVYLCEKCFEVNGLINQA